MERKAVLIIITAIVALMSCNSGKVSEVQAEGDTLRLDHAQLLTIVNYD